MQLTLQRGALKEALSGFGKIVNGRSRLPVLGCARFRVRGNRAEAEVTDLEQSLRYGFDPENTRVEDGEGEFVLPLTALRKLTRGNAADTLALQNAPVGADELPVVNVINQSRGASVNLTLNGFDPEEFPPTPPDVETRPVSGFLPRFRQLAPFASTDTTRPILNSVHVEPGESGENPGTMVATDGRRLSCWNSMTLPVPMQAIVPVTRFLCWNGLGGDGTEIGLHTEEVKHKPAKDKAASRTVARAMVLRNGPWTYYTRLVEGTYPNWRQVLPPKSTTEADTVITITDEDARALPDILPAFPGGGANVKTPSIRLFAGAGDKLSIAGRDPDTRADSTLSLSGGSTFCGKIESVSLDPAFLLDALGAGFRVFRALDAGGPLQSVDGEGGTHVLMPQQVNPQPRQEQSETRETGPVADDPANPENTPEEGRTPQGSEGEPPSQPDKPVASGKTGQNARKGEQKSMSKSENENPSNEPSQALEQVLATTQEARGKLREAGSALSELSTAIKQAIRDHKSQSTDLDKARAMLQKLQAINL